MIISVWLKLLTEAGMRNDRGLIYLTNDKAYSREMLPKLVASFLMGYNNLVEVSFF